MSMESLKSIKAIDNNNNITKFEVLTSKRRLTLSLPYTVKATKTKNIYCYKDNIINKINKLGIYTHTYLFKDWQY